MNNTYSKYTNENFLEQIKSIYNISLDFENKSEVELINKLDLINKICEIGILNFEEVYK